MAFLKTLRRKMIVCLKDNRGFSLLEVLVVMTIIGVLATLVAPAVFRRVGESRQVTARNQIVMFASALESYRLDVGQYPTTEQGLRALLEKPTIPPIPAHWNGPYLMQSPPDDPWGRPYVYRSPGEHNRDGYDLYSLGADGQTGGDGESRDVTNW